MTDQPGTFELTEEETCAVVGGASPYLIAALAFLAGSAGGGAAFAGGVAGHFAGGGNFGNVPWAEISEASF